jgi:endo-1,4-beta-xylanase
MKSFPIACAITCAAGIVFAAAPSPSKPGSGIGQVLTPAATAALKAVDAVHSHPDEIRLWSGAAPGSESQTSPEVINWRTENDTITGQPFTFPTVTNIHFPSITPFLPTKAKAVAGGGAAVIIAPGGGHQFLTINHEGYDVAQYLADHGIAAFVLKYRLARAPTYPNNTYTITRDALADGQRALRVVRSRAAEWGVNPDRIGFMGFSAGGEVAVQVNLNGTDGKADAPDPIDRISCKMNFEALVYPGVSKLVAPAKDWPPIFMACSFDDRADIAGPAAAANSDARPPAQGLADVYLRYKALGIPAELHIYSTGGHGFGVRDRPIEEAHWPDLFIQWLGDRGMGKNP